MDRLRPDLFLQILYNYFLDFVIVIRSPSTVRPNKINQMHASLFYQIQPGRELLLKPARAEAYQVPQKVVFVRVDERPGYSVPWIVTNIGSVKPSEILRLA